MSWNTIISRHDNRSRGFTLIELMAVVTILGILAAIAIAAYSKNVRSAHRTEVIGDMANLGLRQQAFFTVRGHFASTSTDENDTYPVAPANLANYDTAISWGFGDAGFTKDAAADAAYFRGGGQEHGFDVLNFMPESSATMCTYGVISGDGTNGSFGDEPPNHPLSNEVFQIGDAAFARFYARDWYYVFAKCDLDRDGVYWEFTKPHFNSKVSSGMDNQGE